MFDSVGDPGGSGELDSTSYFGEVYYQLTDTVKITAGLRYNDDERKTSTSGTLYNALDATTYGIHPDMFVPGATAPDYYWTRALNLILGAPAADPLWERYVPADQLSAALASGAFSAERFAAAELVPLVPGFNETRELTGSPDKVDFQETTGRIGVDWQWSDNSMLYGFFTRGYKPGGFNPPINPEFQATSAFSFDSEKVDAYEIGSKNMLFDNTLMLNGSVFYYDYGDLQVSRIANNTSLNDNIDAEIYGLEIEGLWRPEQVPGLMIDFSYSYLKAETAGGATSIDPMDRTGGDADFIPLKNIGSGSNTAVAFVARRSQITQGHIDEAFAACRALSSLNPFNATTPTQATGCPLTAAGTDYPDGLPSYFSKSYLNGTAVYPVGHPQAGQPINTQGVVEVSDGFETDIDGNSLPASPENTIKIGVAYDWQLSMGTLTPRLDYHWRDDSYGREFNTRGDQIDAWDQLNASLSFVTNDGTWQAMLWVRNLEDEDNVTGHYLTSDTSGFFRNYFLTEPRIWGASLRYNFGGLGKE
jgi:outer membrane receptor protein involved in Fe transport